MGYSASATLSDQNATTRLGERLAGVLRKGDCLLLSGEIGSGKSHLVRALIQEMLRAEGRDRVDIPSPTYTLVQTYELDIGTLWHADLYRLADSSELAELGLDEAFGHDITLVEWPEMIDEPPADALRIHLSVAGEGREVEFRSEGDRWNQHTNLLEDFDAA